MSGIRGTIDFVGSRLLQPDADNAPDDIAKMRARRNSDGSVTLFATSRSTGLWGRLTGLSSERERARDTLAMWVMRELGPVLSPEAKRVFMDHLGSPELTFGKFRQIAADIERLKAGQRPDIGGIQSQGHAPPPPEVTVEQPPETGATTSSIDLDAQLEGETLTLGSVDYTLGAILGKGGEGDVYLAESETHGKVAVKMGMLLEGGGRFGPTLTPEFEMHRRAFSGGVDGHPSHIVGLKGAVFDRDGVQAIVTEHMAGGSVHALMEKIQLRATETPPPFTEDQVQALRRLILRDMATGLAQVHGMPSLLHRDVKPKNFLINETGVVKIADFGSVQHGPTLRGSDTLQGLVSPPYVAPETNVPDGQIRGFGNRLKELKERPHDTEANGQHIRSQIHEAEVILSQIVVTQASDIFMLGVSALELYSGGGSLDDAQDLRKAQTSDGARDRIFRSYGIGDSAPEHALIRRMLSLDPDQRPTATEIAEQLGGDTAGLAETRALLARIANGT